MPYRIIKKVRVVSERPLVRGSDYSMNFGVDLDDEKTWKLYPLCRGANSHIRGKVSRLFHTNLTEILTINEDFEFDVHCSQVYRAFNEIVETRFLYLPAGLVREYGIAEGMVVDLLLYEITREEWGKKLAIPLFSKIVARGPMDIEPRIQGNTSTTDLKGKIARIQSLMVLVSTGRAGVLEKDKEYKELYHWLDEYFVRFGLANPNPFSTLEEFYGFYRMRFRSYQDRRDYVRGIYNNIEALMPNLTSEAHEKESNSAFEKYDAFICHASEDKEAFVRPLAEALSKHLKIWYDEFSLSMGDSLRRKIDYGISNSRFGIVVLSESFLKKDWPQKELDGLVAKEHDFDKVILPIWHGVTRKQVESFSPTLADRVSVSSDKNMEDIVKDILNAMK